MTDPVITIAATAPHWGNFTVIPFGAKLSPPRRRPRRVARKISERMGVKHWRDVPEPITVTVGPMSISDLAHALAATAWLGGKRSAVG